MPATNGTNGIGSASFRIRTGWVRKARFLKFATISLTAGPSIRPGVTVALDRKIPSLQLETIRNWFAGGSVARNIMAVADLQELIPSVNLAQNMGRIELIAVSPKFSRNQIRDNGKTLALTLKDVLQKSQELESKRAAQIFQQMGTIMDGIDAPAAASGTVFDTGYQAHPGGELFKLAVSKLLPLDVEAVHKDKGEFQDWIIDSIGRKNIGTYEVELAIARQMFLRGQLPNHTFKALEAAIRGDRQTATPGPILRMALKAAPSSYLEEFESALTRRITKSCKKTFHKLNKLNRRKDIDIDGIAILTLGIVLGAISEQMAIKHVKGEEMQPVKHFLDVVKNYLETEEERIFSIKMSVNIMKAEIS